MKSSFLLSVFFFIAMLSTSCKFTEQVETRLKLVSNYERAALTLSKENRELQSQIATLKFEIQGLKTKNNFLTVQLEKKKVGREVASIAPVNAENDLVKFETYRWSPSQLLAMAQKDFEDKNYEKSAQFFRTFLGNYSSDKRIDDQFLFQAGIAAFESGARRAFRGANGAESAVFPDASEIVHIGGAVAHRRHAAGGAHGAQHGAHGAQHGAHDLGMRGDGLFRRGIHQQIGLEQHPLTGAHEGLDAAQRGEQRGQRVADAVVAGTGLQRNHRSHAGTLAVSRPGGQAR